ncbi:putative 4'-phosphopantetheinyl transferase superfamily protein [Monocercomonoides exilis]|uniref:putative 4'-phosphopantetheinyl transferase superfamily protein n=1 Tax=Monocercomonoides exilis TaxID=2049356 RepID=UPI003559EFD6|nr:putative 4'-phosphopantetheinyl transferase superfamily protein [Monocercomonoides exilis]|eukprot:MONOS_16424.1-p1 / transcript=MONOS_16424.1 / gene=MONOS_16424 / organism=Monocercomonoides_exilis_PA203 / gene_product=4'-phosphopantetheinyl transferase superfamily protein / transcript_product=4'-phosphopantetheinyl transferase superfamily protein / location=Mono_scaffold01723:745-1794(-) / protein_length=349 / sequence_SO=supercontig / SO=protein_coding / is_pseudo=false
MLLDNAPLGRYRIVVNANEWKETDNDEFERAIALVGEEEQERIRKFKFIKDAKTALIGRLILNAMAVKTLGIRNASLKWKRTDKGKPFIDPACVDGISTANHYSNFSYNISHSGHWVVGASELEFPIGIDVNDHGLRPNCKIDFDEFDDVTAEENFEILKSYFSTFKHIFSPPEAKHMESLRFKSGPVRLLEFSRFWTSKESFVKVSGLGFNFDVARLHFDFSEYHQSDIPKMPTSVMAAPIKVSVDGKDVSSEWMFEQFILDRYHIVNVAIRTNPESLSNSSVYSSSSSTPSSSTSAEHILSSGEKVESEIIHASLDSKVYKEKIEHLHPLPLLLLKPADIIKYLEEN